MSNKQFVISKSIVLAATDEVDAVEKLQQSVAEGTHDFNNISEWDVQAKFDPLRDLTEDRLSIKAKQEFLKDPNHCPYCGSENINAGAIDLENYYAEWDCDDCLETWAVDFNVEMENVRSD